MADWRYSRVGFAATLRYGLPDSLAKLAKGENGAKNPCKPSSSTTILAPEEERKQQQKKKKKKEEAEQEVGGADLLLCLFFFSFSGARIVVLLDGLQGFLAPFPPLASFARESGSPYRRVAAKPTRE